MFLSVNCCQQVWRDTSRLAGDKNTVVIRRQKEKGFKNVKRNINEYS